MLWVLEASHLGTEYAYSLFFSCLIVYKKRTRPWAARARLLFFFVIERTHFACCALEKSPFCGKYDKMTTHNSPTASNGAAAVVLTRQVQDNPDIFIAWKHRLKPGCRVSDVAAVAGGAAVGILPDLWFFCVAPALAGGRSPAAELGCADQRRWTAICCWILSTTEIRLALKTMRSCSS